MSRHFSPLKLLRPQSNGDPKKGLLFKISKIAFNLSRYNRLGLYSDDVYVLNNNLLREALRRLPKDVLDARNFRMIRAIHLNSMKMYLPKEKWITFEQDVEYRYLQPYVREIMAEKREVYDFGCTNYHEDDWPAGELK